MNTKESNNVPIDRYTKVEATEAEKEYTKLVQIIDELNGVATIKPESFGNGYDKRAYNHCTMEMVDTLTRELCSRLKKIDSSPEAMLQYSQQLRNWWIDHKVMDNRHNKSCKEK